MRSSSLPILSSSSSSSPSWLRVPAPGPERTEGVRRELGPFPTVCVEARCPNQGVCWSEGTATFLLMGETCTRGCRFCAVTSGHPSPLDPSEPARLQDAVLRLGLTDVVVTSVDRDDLGDGGAAHLARCIEAVRAIGVSVELLAPDFGGDVEAVSRVIDAGLDVFAHNVETVPRLTSAVRDRRATFSQSLAVLAAAKARSPSLLVKSGLMLGLGEDDDEVIDTLIALRDVGTDIVTIGQYLRPTRRHLQVARLVEPDTFAALADDARSLGFVVAAGPLVRSSYRAASLAQTARARRSAGKGAPAD
jgi:lipoic acid synthetase